MTKGNNAFNIFTNIFNIILVIATVVMVVCSAFLIYFKTLGSDKVPTGVTSTYVTKMVDPLTKIEYNAIEANYYANLNNSGYECVELLINSYSGVSKQTMYSRGFQLLWNDKGEIVKYTDPNTNITYDYYEYNRNNSNQSFQTGHHYNFKDPMFIDINGKTYAVELDGTYNITTKKFSLGKAALHTITGLWTGWDYNEGAYWTETKTYNYTFTDLLVKIKEIIQSSSTGTGNAVLALVDLGDFLHVYDVDEETGQISGTPVAANKLINSYFTTQTHYDRRGLTYAQQSIFSSVAGNNDFNISKIDFNVDYWQARHEIKLDESCLSKRYSETDNGYYYYLGADVINNINSYDNTEIVLDIDINNLESPLGLDYYALHGVQIKSLILRGPISEFTLLYNALLDTNLDVENIEHSASITIIDKTREVVTL